MTTTVRDSLLGDDLFERQWWFVRIYTHGFDGADPLIGDLLPPVVSEARALGIERWFFIRYLDEHGPHVRLRVLGNRDVLDRLQRVLGELEDQLDRVLATHPTQQGFIAPIPRASYEGRQATGVRGALYEPEWAKYGGTDGLALAEELFEFSSDLALWACGRFEKTGERAGLATLLLADVADGMLHGPAAGTRERQRISWDRYWDRHLDWWTADLGHRGPAVRKRMQDSAAARADSVVANLQRVEQLPSVGSWRRRWWLAIDAYLERAAALEVPRTPQHLIFHQGHMMLNRLGFLPREEAVLGVHARLWRNDQL